MHAKAADGAFRVLWLGDQRPRPGLVGRRDGLAYATSEDGGPDARWLWNAAGPGPASGLASAVDLARPAAPTSSAGCWPRPGPLRGPADLAGPRDQRGTDPDRVPGPRRPGRQPSPVSWTSSPVLSGTGITVYQNTAWLPQRAEVPAGTAVATGRPPIRRPGAPAPVSPGRPCRSCRGDRRPVLPRAAGQRDRAGLHGPVRPLEPDRSRRGPAARSSSFGWAARYRVAAAGVRPRCVSTGGLAPLSFVLSLVTWLVVVALLRRGWSGAVLATGRGFPVPDGEPEGRPG